MDDAKRERAKVRSEILKNYFEIAALCLAGAWAIYTFVVKDLPILKRHVDSVEDKVKLSWSEPPTPIPGFCQADWSVTVKNTGLSSVRIHKVWLRVWRFNPPRASGRIEYFQFMEPQPPILFNKEFTGEGEDIPLTGKLSSGDEVGHDFTFLIPRTPADELLVFDLRLLDEGGDKLMHLYQPPTRRCLAEASRVP